MIVVFDPVVQFTAVFCFHFFAWLLCAWLFCKAEEGNLRHRETYTSCIGTTHMAEHEMTEAEKNIERYKVKKMIKMLEAARGLGSSVMNVGTMGQQMRKPLNMTE